MAAKFPKEGQVQLETDLLGQGTREDWSLRLFSTAHTPAVTDTLATYTAIECAIAGYAPITLTRAVGAGNWSAPGATGTLIDPTNNNARASYGAAAPQFTFTANGTVNGYFVRGVTSGKCIFAEQYASPITNVTTLNQPVNFELGSA